MTESGIYIKISILPILGQGQYVLLSGKKNNKKKVCEAASFYIFLLKDCRF
jgi:hypothetical protein